MALYPHGCWTQLRPVSCSGQVSIESDLGDLGILEMGYYDSSKMATPINSGSSSHNQLQLSVPRDLAQGSCYNFLSCPWQLYISSRRGCSVGCCRLLHVAWSAWLLVSLSLRLSLGRGPKLTHSHSSIASNLFLFSVIILNS